MITRAALGNDGVVDVAALTLVEHHGYSPRSFSTRL